LNACIEHAQALNSRCLKDESSCHLGRCQSKHPHGGRAGSKLLSGTILAALALVSLSTAWASGRLSIMDYPPPGGIVDASGKADDSQALANVVKVANAVMAKGQPVCIYLPAGTYRITTAPPPFTGPGCVIGDGPAQSMLYVDSQFKGDLFSWSEAWLDRKPGAMVVGIKILGSRSSTASQNAFVFYDRNDEVLIENVDVSDLHGRALYSGVTKNASVAYMRESRMTLLRFFNDGAPGIPVVEFCSQGSGNVDATNEVRLTDVDIYGSNGPSFVIRNHGSGAIRDITIDNLRIEGTENGNVTADLLTIGDPSMKGNVNNVVLNSVELIDPYRGYAALRLTAAPGAAAPYQIAVQGSISGGAPNGQGLRIDAGRTSTFRFSGIHTLDTNVVIGSGVSGIVLDGGGQEEHWTYKIDPSSRHAVSVPTLRTLDAAGLAVR
jgi:hypothetical protein